ncbi:MAG TPA: tetratricopeptide repeat protein [Drouetiella sp.]
MPPLLNGKIEENTGLYGALTRVKDLDITYGVLRVAADNSIGLVGISSCKEIVGAVIKDENASKLLNAAAVDKILSLTHGTFEFYEIPQKELLRLNQNLSLDISDILERSREHEAESNGHSNGHGVAEAESYEETSEVAPAEEAYQQAEEEAVEQSDEVAVPTVEPESVAEETASDSSSEEIPAYLEETADIPERGVTFKKSEEIPSASVLDSIQSPSKGLNKSELDSIPTPGSGLSKSDLDSIPTPGSGLNKSDLDSIPTPGAGLNKSDLDSIPTPGSGLNKSDLDSIPTPGSGLKKSDLDSIPTPGAGLKKSDLDSISTPGAGANKFDLDAIPTPKAGGTGAGKLELDSIPTPKSGATKNEAESASKAAASGSATGSLLAKFKEKKPSESATGIPEAATPVAEPSTAEAAKPSDDDEVNRNAAATVERIKKFRRPDAELEAEAEKAQRNKFASRKSRPEEEAPGDAQAEASRIRPAGKQQATTLKERAKPKPVPMGVKIGIGAAVAVIGVVAVARIPVANYLIGNAQAQIDKHDFSGASSTLATATMIDPWNGKAHFLKGELAKAQKDNSKAFEELEQAAQSQPDDPETLKAYVLAARKVGRFDLVKSGTENLMAHDSLSASDGYWLGILAQSHFSLGEYKDAISIYSKALQSGLRTPWIYSGRAWAELYANNPKAAIKDFNTALALPKDKSQADAQIGKGQALTQLNDLNGALACYNAALEMDSKMTYGYLRRAGLYLQMNQQDKAMADYDQALHIDPKFAEASVGKANVYAKRGKLDQALKELKNVKGVDYERGALLMQSNQFAAAAESFKKGLEAHQTKDPAKYMDLAYCYSKIKKHKEALEACQHAVDLAPKNSEYIAMHGLYLNNMGQTVSARADYETALRLNPKNAEAHLWRGMLSAGAGDMISARQDFEEAAHLKPSLSASIDALKKSDRKYLAASAAANAPRQRRALPLIDGDYKTLLMTGYTKLKNHQLDGAVQYLASALNKDPNSLEARRYLAYAFTLQGNYADAVEQYRSIVGMSGTNVTDQRNYAEVLMKADHPEDASAVYLSLLVNNEHDTESRCKLANCYSAMGKLQEAVDACENGKKVDPAGTAAYTTMISKLQHHQTAQPKTQAPSTQAPSAIPSG